MNDGVVIGLHHDQEEGLSGLCHMEGVLSRRHGAALPAAAAWATLTMSEALAKNGGVGGVGGVSNVGGVSKKWRCGKR